MKNKIIRLSLVLLLGVFSIVKSQAQNEEDRKRINSKTNVELLTKFAEEEKSFFDRNYTLAIEKAKEKGVAIKGTNEKGSYYEIISYDSNSDSFIYQETKNNVPGSSSINTIKVGYLHSKGVKGSGMLVGEWDGAVARITHQALAPRVVLGDPQGSVTQNPQEGYDHATHVAGTMIGGENAGGANKAGQAKGMAPEAKVKSFNWNNDLTKMANSATQDALLASNHSYGKKNEDLKNLIGLPIFGRYTGAATKQKYGIQTSRDYDIIANNAPYYTIVFAAGNDRAKGLNPVMAGKDLLEGSGNAKNLIVVGAINGISSYSGASSAVMSSFSNWGPTDDFRVKPDIVSKGVNVYSSLSGANDEYGFQDGTSMAAPSVTGAIILWQQYYKQFANEYMRSSTVRALMAHTALEAGSQEGPDFMYGWGVFNTEGGAKVIEGLNNDTGLIEEIKLSNGQTVEKDYSREKSSDFTVTIAWNDPAGTETTSTQANFFEPALVNDLDLRVVNTDTNTTYFPYRLKNSWPGMVPASCNEKGDNIVDNIEKIFVPNAPAGNYKIVISHKGSLSGGSQLFSLVSTGHNGPLSMDEIVLNKLKVYPNPFNDYFMIGADSANDLISAGIHLYDISGKVVLEKKINNDDDLRIDTSILNKGVYLLTIDKNGASKTFKLVK